MSEDEVFFNNIKRRIIDIAIQTRHASKKGISNQAKSGYYRFATLLACTIAEGLLYKLVRKHLDDVGGGMGEAIVYSLPHNIPSEYSNKKIVLCIQEKKVITLSNQTKFTELIKYAINNKLVPKKEKIKLEKIMRLRNKIHLQSLNGRDNGYTKQKLDDIFSTIDFLIKK